ncbi:MAG: hypothetical protein RL211_1242 [Pseudomonadota bacterium]|jgi:diguanylate cyclase (GGDEF)-like protein
MTESQMIQAGQQAIRLKRFLVASSTYAFGWVFLALFHQVGLFASNDLLAVGLAFLVINLSLYAVFLNGLNLRFKDPSLTQLQVSIGALMVAVMLSLGQHIHFLAIPFYSALFVFAMLQLKPVEMVKLEVFVLLTYGLALTIRQRTFAMPPDLRIELIYAAIVVLSSAWYTLAASYISSLRARLRASVQSLEQLATRDALTNAWNRRHMDALLAAELDRKTRIGGNLCVCMVDLDFFKSINDRFGHPVGDSTLIKVKDAMQSELRSIDQLGRFGGEEFLIILPGVSLKDAAKCAERLLQKVTGLVMLPDPSQTVTVSVGLAECKADESAATLLTRADAALYRAKQEGRNRVAISPSGDAII